MLPIFLSGQHCIFNSLSLLDQVNSYCSTYLAYPFLHNRNACLLRCRWNYRFFGVCNGKSVYSSIISRYFIFFYRILYFISACIVLRHCIKCNLPCSLAGIFSFCYGLCLNRFALSFFHQVNSDCITYRSCFAVLIYPIFSNF